MELTTKYLDQALKGTEQRIVQQLTKRIDEAQEELARIVADTIAAPFSARFDQLEDSLAVKEDLEKLKTQMREIRSALHLSA